MNKKLCGKIIITRFFRKGIICNDYALDNVLNGSIDNQINRQTIIALNELVKDINKLTLYGHRINPQ